MKQQKPAPVSLLGMDWKHQQELHEGIIISSFMSIPYIVIQNLYTKFSDVKCIVFDIP